MKHYDEKVTAYRITASIEDFEGNLQEWKDAFYELWRVQLTWKPAYNITLIERRGDDRQWYVNLDVTVKKAHKDKMVEWMGKNGYKNLYIAEEAVGLVNPYDHDDLEDVWHLILDK